MKYQGRSIRVGCSLLMLLLLQSLGGKVWASPNNDLLHAVQEKNLAAVQHALENGADANARDEHGIPALIIAVFGRDPIILEHLPALQALVRAKMHIEDISNDSSAEDVPDYSSGMNSLTDSFFFSILRASPKKGDLDVIEILLRHGADVNAIPAEGPLIGWTALFAAVFNHDVAAGRLLLDHGADANVIAPQGLFSGLTLLLFAMHEQDSEDVELLDLLLQYGADANATYPEETGLFLFVHEGWTALIKAAYKNDIKTVALLLHYGADVNFIVPEGSYKGDSVLVLAEAHKNQEMIELLLQAGATPLEPHQQAEVTRFQKEFARDALHTWHCGGGYSGCAEEHDVSYEHYNYMEIAEHIPLPRESEHIDWFSYGAGLFGGVKYEFVQASVKPADIDLKQLVTDCLQSRSEEAILIENAPFTMEGFYRVFVYLQSEDDNFVPQWWNDENGMRDFTVNVVTYHNDNKDGGHGYELGCWAFYNEHSHTLRVFRWLQGAVLRSAEDFCNLFKEDNPLSQKENDASSQEARCTTNAPLQQFALHDLQLTGIIIGGLGNYARVQTPDGISCTINVGTRVGKNAGEVVDISEKSVRVREYIQNAKGNIEEVETLLYLHPPED